MILEIRQEIDYNGKAKYYVPVYQNDWITWDHKWFYINGEFMGLEKKLFFNGLRFCISVIKKKFPKARKLDRPINLPINSTAVIACFKV